MLREGCVALGEGKALDGELIDSAKTSWSQEVRAGLLAKEDEGLKMRSDRLFMYFSMTAAVSRLPSSACESWRGAGLSDEYGAECMTGATAARGVSRCPDSLVERPHNPGTSAGLDWVAAVAAGFMARRM